MDEDYTSGGELEQLGKGVSFTRLRRITGYLVGDLRTWGDGKLAEERDRVKHGVEEEIK